MTNIQIEKSFLLISLEVENSTYFILYMHDTEEFKIFLCVYYHYNHDILELNYINVYFHKSKDKVNRPFIVQQNSKISGKFWNRILFKA